MLFDGRSKKISNSMIYYQNPLELNYVLQCLRKLLQNFGYVSHEENLKWKLNDSLFMSLLYAGRRLDLRGTEDAKKFVIFADQLSKWPKEPFKLTEEEKKWCLDLVQTWMDCLLSMKPGEGGKDLRCREHEYFTEDDKEHTEYRWFYNERFIAGKYAKHIITGEALDWFFHLCREAPEAGEVSEIILWNTFACTVIINGEDGDSRWARGESNED